MAILGLIASNQVLLFQITESSNDVFRVATTEFAAPAFLVTSNNTVGINHFQPSAALHVLESGTNALIMATSAFATPALLVTSR